MVATEQEHQQQSEFQPVPDQFSDDVAERLAEQGVTVTQTQPQKLTDDKGQTLVQPTATPSDDDLAAGVIVPFGEEEASERRKGKPENSMTWLAVLVDKFIRVAKHTHKKIFIRK